VEVKVVPKVGEGRPDVIDLLEQGKISLVVITQSSDEPALVAVSHGKEPFRLEGRRTVGYMIRTTALKRKIPYLTTVESLRAAVAAIRKMKKGSIVKVRRLTDTWKM
jgi:carbamoyl-phosphate synthase large subunit